MKKILFCFFAATILLGFPCSNVTKEGARVWLDISQVSLGLFKNGKMYTREIDGETGYRVYKRFRVVWSEYSEKSTSGLG
jgi:hypothetical protein